MNIRTGASAHGARATLPRRFAAGIAAAALAATVPAWGGTYTVTARTTGSSGDFDLPGLFTEGTVRGIGRYDLTVTGVFDTADVTSDAGQQWLHASDVDLRITLIFNDTTYTVNTTGQLNTQVFTDTGGDGRLMKRLYQSMTFDPAGPGNYARFEQYLFLDAHQFPVSSVLAPVTTYYADPIVKGFTIHDAYVDGSGSSTYGEAFGQAETFRYQVALAVPEPGTWAMLAAGLAVLGYAGRRRSRR